MSENQPEIENHSANETQAPLEHQPLAEPQAPFENDTPAENQAPPANDTPPTVESNLPVPAPMAAATLPVTTPPAPRVRPTGVTIIAILAVIQGFGGLCAGVFMLFLGGILAVIPSGWTQILAVLACFGGLLVVAGPLLELLFAYGAWNLRKWGWALGIVASVISIGGVVIGLIGTGGASIWTVVTNALIPLVILVYLLMPNVRKAFNV